MSARHHRHGSTGLYRAPAGADASPRDHAIEPSGLTVLKGRSRADDRHSLGGIDQAASQSQHDLATESWVNEFRT